jgi:predicted O-linked N-acetylglucosamine transferase (SPINDLY family)
MLKWLATHFERRRGALQIRLENSLRAKTANNPARLESAEFRRRGNEFLGAGNLTEAEQCYRSGIAADPTDAVCHSNLGYVLFEQGRRSDAVAALEQAVTLDQTDFDAYYMLGNIARDRQETLRAIVCYRTALRVKPDFDFCRRDLCVALAQSGKIKEAQRVMDEGPSFGVDTANYHFFKGNLHHAEDQVEEATACFAKAAELSPLDTTILCNLCALQLKSNNVFAALNTGQRLVELDPDHVQAYGLLAVANQFTGRYDLTVDYYRKALQLDPNCLHVHQNLLFSLTYFPDFPQEEYLREARYFSAKTTARATPYAVWHSTAHAKGPRALRVGFVSGDLCFHPVGMFLQNVLGFLDASKVECIAYSNRNVEDAYSAALRPLFNAWNVVAGISDAALAQKIHSDQIDILVDLAGHTGQNRLAVFAWRPAPVQVAWLGYWAGTGLAEMDYLLVDRSSVHEGEAQYYSEQLWLLPDTRLCFSPPPATLQHLSSGPVPALKNGHITFGSFQTLSKVSDATLAVWSEVLAQLPTARIRLQSHVFRYAESVAHMRKRLAVAQIDPSRVDLMASTGWELYMAAYSEVDVVLDTFPFPGGTTTAEALWMGVPTVTLTGKSLVARQGESMLRCVGLGDWVATSAQDYVCIALEKVADLATLGALRAELRSKALASPLFDGERFARNLETALLGMFQAKQQKLTGSKLEDGE